jgi:hypothetical protein
LSGRASSTLRRLTTLSAAAYWPCWTFGAFIIGSSASSSMIILSTVTHLWYKIPIRDSQ